jgi:methylmalonyl-CoA mutase C-terminal domain/subunit
MSVAPTPALAGKRILIAKPGLDGHDIGAKIVALALRDAGAEVIYTGIRKTPDFIARIAVDEDVDAVGLSILSGSHVELVRQTRESLAQLGGESIPMFVGGTIPKEDRDALIALGVVRIFTSEMPLPQVVAEVVEAIG